MLEGIWIPTTPNLDMFDLEFQLFISPMALQGILLIKVQSRSSLGINTYSIITFDGVVLQRAFIQEKVAAIDRALVLERGQWREPATPHYIRGREGTFTPEWTAVRP